MKRHFYNSPFSMLALAVAGNLLLSPCLARAEHQPSAQGAETLEAILELPLEDLLQLEVTSASKKSQQLGELAKAAFVITPEDIQHSGATAIPELLRMVPGINVMRVDANKWSVSARGFNGRYSRKLLVLIDGRSIYTPLYAGVYWDSQDVMLEDVARIEVIRGPGGTIWGANAMNGVINIITKSAEETQGGLVSTGLGTEYAGMSMRYGGVLGAQGHYRLYAKGMRWDDSLIPAGQVSNDGWNSGRVGFRTDFELKSDEKLTILGESSRGKVDGLTTVNAFNANSTLVDDEDDVRGSHLIARWEKGLANEGLFTLQGYLDYTYRDSRLFHDERTTVDLEFHHLFKWRDHHEMIWGGGVRYLRDKTEGNYTISVDPKSDEQLYLNAFVQDEIHFPEQDLILTVGTKVERAPDIELQWQPSLRLSWQPREGHTLWAGVSRAVHTPSRFEQDGQVQIASVINTGGGGTMPYLMQITSPVGIDAEKVIAYEVGYRSTLSKDLTTDIALFYNDYDDLLAFDSKSVALSMVNGVATMLYPVSFANNVTAEAYGLEWATEWRPSPHWAFQLAYSYLNLQLHAPDGFVYNENGEGESPRNQISLRTSHKLTDNWHLDGWLRYTDALSSFAVPSYTTLDLQLHWQPSAQMKFAVVGHNLLDSHHAEGQSEFFSSPAAEIQRSVLATMQWHF
uniref:Putative TonB-dependent receptor n=1 Tax=Magnetococcus massalia (strain MO-1) TaxID=451514 RepID=A0A1S7LH37_MAGMO|nr:putative TonB-dependent receptor [Candidatus Magnetococcus massalia]